jgi:acetoin utilization deacetylase AcuC-like enzyme
MSFRIRGVFDDFLPVNRRAIEQILNITESQIADMSDESLQKIRSLFVNPVMNKMRYYFFIAENNRGEILGFAQMSYAVDLKFCFLDLIANNNKKATGGIGEALYKRVKDEAVHLAANGLFIECMSDNSDYFSDKTILKQNRIRLKFYERLGARPLLNPGYEKQSITDYGNPYFLLLDPLGEKMHLSLQDGKKIVRAVLERKHLVSAGDVSMRKLLNSMADDPLLIRPQKYLKDEFRHYAESVPEDRKIPLLYNEGHEIHHIKEKGYVESPVRIKSILKVIDKSRLFQKHKSRHYSERYITAVHDKDFVNYFRKASASVPQGMSLYPDTFPIRKKANPPKKLVSRAGYYCIDIYSPVNRNSYFAAKGAVDCTMTGADLILAGSPIVYSLVRPPGHHAERNSFGGFCYFNNAAIAADYLSHYGRVVILDLDYHHGNGQQDIFYRRDDVLTISIHADPDYEYPYFSGFRYEAGEEKGSGYNINFPLPIKTDGVRYRHSLEKSIKAIKKFSPDFLVVALGLDTAKGDPSGKWNLVKEDFFNNGKLIGTMNLRTLVVQEGGYDSRVLGINVLSFFQGLYNGKYSSKFSVRQANHIGINKEDKRY